MRMKLETENTLKRSTADKLFKTSMEQLFKRHCLLRTRKLYYGREDEVANMLHFVEGEKNSKNNNTNTNSRTLNGR